MIQLVKQFYSLRCHEPLRPTRLSCNPDCGSKYAPCLRNKLSHAPSYNDTMHSAGLRVDSPLISYGLAGKSYANPALEDGQPQQLMYELSGAWELRVACNPTQVT